MIIHDAHAIFTFGNLEFGNAAFANEIDQCFKFSEVHDLQSL